MHYYYKKTVPGTHPLAIQIKKEQNVRKLSFYILAIILFSPLLSACNTIDTKEESNIIGQEYFLKVNVWYERPKKIISTNYHKGAILKAGEKFKIIDLAGKKIIFSDKNEIEYAIIHHRKHNPISLTELFDNYFSKTSVSAPGGAFTKLTPEEQKNIRNGLIVKGMSKDAVLMSYGYPPGHRTPTLKSDSWIYWANRWVSKRAIFENGKLVSYQ